MLKFPSLIAQHIPGGNVHLSKSLVTIGSLGTTALCIAGRRRPTRCTEQLRQLDLKLMRRDDYLNFRDEWNRLWQICIGPNTTFTDREAIQMRVKSQAYPAARDRPCDANLSRQVVAGESLTINFADGRHMTVMVIPGSLSLLLHRSA